MESKKYVFISELEYAVICKERLIGTYHLKHINRAKLKKRKLGFYVQFYLRASLT